MFTRSKAKLASTLEPAEVLESTSLQIGDEGSGNAISHEGPKSTQNSVSLSHTCSTQHDQVVSEYLGFDHGPQTSDSPINEVPTMDTDQVA